MTHNALGHLARTLLHPWLRSPTIEARLNRRDAGELRHELSVPALRGIRKGLPSRVTW
jgi:hypothetical protein